MISQAKCFEEIYAYTKELPVVDCHDHAAGREKVEDIIALFAQGYFMSDLTSATSDGEAGLMADASVPLERRAPVFQKAFSRARFTGYGLAVRKAMERMFGFSEVTLNHLKEMQERLPDFSDPGAYDSFYEDAHIVARIADVWPPVKQLVDGSYKKLPGQYLAIGLPGYHNLRNRMDITNHEMVLKRTVTNLDEYLELCRDIFEVWRRNGAVCFKDQSAYGRSIAYRNPTRHEAEILFNRILEDPRYFAPFDPDGNALSDYLMHEFMRIAKEMSLPVQIHTGHMAGIRNDVAKANASGLRSLMEIHRDVSFDLFHANWPYSADILFLIKNYPNAALDLCWTHIIDPIYSRDILIQAVSAVPYSKIHGFGSDVGGTRPHIAWAHCEIAKENIAAALAELVNIDYLQVEEAKQLAAGWLFHNPNRFFKLGLTDLPSPE
jgi:hypothetical protein